MSQGEACRTPGHRPAWRVTTRRANYSAFNGGRRTPSAYSEVRCAECRRTWRTKAAYVDSLPDACGYDRPVSEPATTIGDYTVHPDGSSERTSG